MPSRILIQRALAPCLWHLAGDTPMSYLYALEDAASESDDKRLVELLTQCGVSVGFAAGLAQQVLRAIKDPSELVRQTGRTTGTLKRALTEARNGRTVVLVVTTGMETTIKAKLAEMCQDMTVRKRIRVTKVSGGSADVVLEDHLVVELRHASIVDAVFSVN